MALNSVSYIDVDFLPRWLWYQEYISYIKGLLGAFPTSNNLLNDLSYSEYGGSLYRHN